MNLNQTEIGLIWSINITTKPDYLADHPILASFVGTFLCLATLSLIGCLIIINMYLKNLHLLVKIHLVASIVQQIVHQFILFGAFIAMVAFWKQNWTTCTLTFNVLGGSMMLGMAFTTILSVVRYYDINILLHDIFFT